jgi:poly [ADP-ribose] polymerase
MAHTIEVAKTGRATCRTCRQPIAKGDHRFGEETANAFDASGGTMFLWHHLACAAKKKPTQLGEALRSFAGEVPNREELERTIAAEAPKQKPIVFPYAERASTARSRCGACEGAIEKGELRVATPRDAEMGGMVNASVRYFHARCAKDAAGGGDVLEALRKNSKGLEEGDFEEIARALGS